MEGCVFLVALSLVLFSYTIDQKLDDRTYVKSEYKMACRCSPGKASCWRASMIILPAFTIQRFLGGMFAFWYYNREGSSRTKRLLSSGLDLWERCMPVMGILFCFCKVHSYVK